MKDVPPPPKDVIPPPKPVVGNPSIPFSSVTKTILEKPKNGLALGNGVETSTQHAGKSSPATALRLNPLPGQLKDEVVIVEGNLLITQTQFLLLQIPLQIGMRSLMQRDQLISPQQLPQLPLEPLNQLPNKLELRR